MPAPSTRLPAQRISTSSLAKKEPPLDIPARGREAVRGGEKETNAGEEPRKAREGGGKPDERSRKLREEEPKVFITLQPVGSSESIQGAENARKRDLGELTNSKRGLLPVWFPPAFQKQPRRGRG